MWSDVVGYQGVYEVSDMGEVRSVDRTIGSRTFKGKVLLPSLKSNGRLSVNLSYMGKHRTMMIHRLVLETFEGPCPEGMECCHNDGDALNNRLDNLRWDTRANNHADKRQHGTAYYGERHHSTDLCELDVWLIRNLSGSQLKIAQFFGISEMAVNKIKRRITWAHVGD